jgi:GNAT superfamily N-acetyltransferase
MTTNYADAEWVTIREMKPGEERRVSELIIDLFRRYIAADYPRAGIRDFLHYASPEAIADRVNRDHVVLVAVDRATIVGVIDVDDFRHFDLLFVDDRFRGRGIARRLVDRATELCLEERPALKEITADTSTYGIPIFHALGFAQAGTQLESHGRQFIRMRRKLTGRTR